MQNFLFYNPTKIIFGRGAIASLGEHLPTGKKIMMVWGGGSIKRNGVYDQVINALQGHEFIEFSGVQPNPEYKTCLAAVECVRSEGIEFLLAVGGGSVLDASKFISAAALYQGDEPWDILRTYGEGVSAMLPVAGVMTLPATGSESNPGAVISRHETQEKLVFSSPLAFPVFSILDPEATFSLPKNQVRNGIVDSFVHICEQYITIPNSARLQERFAEGVLQTLVEVGPVTLDKPQDYDPRAEFVWCATMALNTLVGMGGPQDWATHMIGHELTALYGISHAESLALVQPGVLRQNLESKRQRLEQYGLRVWGVNSAEEAIERTEGFYLSLGMPTRLSDYDIDAEDAATRIEERFTNRGMALGEEQNLTPDIIANILRHRA